MSIATGKTRISLVVGLLALAGFLSDGRLATAQSQLDCPLPAGVTPVEPPRVTAQQVEDGSAALRDFALAATERFASETGGLMSVQQVAYFGCVVRQEGGPWRHGSTYVV